MFGRMLRLLYSMDKRGYTFIRRFFVLLLHFEMFFLYMFYYISNKYVFYPCVLNLPFPGLYQIRDGRILRNKIHLALYGKFQTQDFVIHISVLRVNVWVVRDCIAYNIMLVFLCCWRPVVWFFVQDAWALNTMNGQNRCAYVATERKCLCDTDRHHILYTGNKVTKNVWVKLTLRTIIVVINFIEVKVI